MNTKPNIRFLDRTTPPHILTLVLLAGISTMTMNVFLPALPEMTTYFDTSYGYMQLSVGVFMGMNAVLQLIVGPMSDRFGRRPVAMLGVVLFIIATFAALHATTITMFLILRGAQAAVVTGMVLSRAAVRDIYPGQEAATMMAYVTMGVALVPMLSPTLGGFLAMAYGWESTFWLMLSSGVVIFLLIFFDMGETAPKSGGSFREMAKGFPDLLTSQRFLGYALCTAFSSGTFFAFLGGAPFVGVQIFGISEATLGMGIGAPAIGYFVGNFLSARLSVRIGMNNMCLIGTLVTFSGVAACALFIFTDHITVFWFFTLMIPLGLGNGLTIPNAVTGSMSVRPKLTGTAAGLGGAMMTGGGAALSAMAGSFMSVENGALPLLLIMVSVSFCSILSIVWVMQRERALNA